MYRDYKIDPEDRGEFVPSYDVEEISSEGNIYYFDKGEENPTPHLKYFVRVGGGYRGFKKKQNAKNCINEPI
jgi:hypothetical protein